MLKTYNDLFSFEQLVNTFDEIRSTMKKYSSDSGTSGAVYGLGLIGAAIYFIGKSTGFWMGAMGLLKALVWPAILVYEVLVKIGA